MVTAQNGIFLSVLTADCVPLLFIAPKQRLAAAVHAGWRGTLAGIASKTVDYFMSRYGVAAGDLEVALGPSIGVCCYEVNDDVATPLMKKWGALMMPSIAMKDGKPHINLSRLNRDICATPACPARNFSKSAPARVVPPKNSFPIVAKGGDRPADRCGRLAGDVTLRCNSVRSSRTRRHETRQEQHWLSESFVDPNGRLFEWRGELHLAALDPAYAARWQQWAKSGVIDGLVRNGLSIESEWSGLKTDSGKAVLHHRRVVVQSHRYEWPPAMLRDAASPTIDLCIA